MLKLNLVRLTRNKQGQLSRASEIIEAESIRVGRGSDCNLHLPDSRVAMLHAVLTKNNNGAVTLEATADVVTDGRANRVILLEVGQRISLGPYAIKVEAAAGSKTVDIDLDSADGSNADITISLELVETAQVKTIQTVGKATRLNQTWLSKRFLSWSSVIIITLAFLVWPVYHALLPEATQTAIVKSKLLAKTATGNSALPAAEWSASQIAAHRLNPNITPTESWNPGPLDSGHASFGRDCSQCHQTPFVQVQNQSCENCHSTVGWHFALDTPAAKKLHTAVFAEDTSEGRCAECHRDHKGVNALKRQDSPLCTDCHSDLKTRHDEVGIANVTDLKNNHPPFKLSMLIPGKVGKEALVRVSQDDKANLVERSNLKFPHDVHMAKKGVRSPSASQNNGKVVMTCDNCHTPDETGTRFKPITMKQHCQDCHKLDFEPAASNRQVPHGKVDDVIDTVNSFYAEAAFLNKPIDATADRGPNKTIAWVNKKAQTIVTEMMEKRTCYACHTITKTENSWEVAPVLITQHWLPKSRFPHVQHNTYDCAKCHDVVTSKLATDIAIPDLKNCQSCHSGNVREVDKAPGTCETCHGFHVGGSHAGKPVVLPKPAPVKSSIASLLPKTSFAAIVK